MCCNLLAQLPVSIPSTEMKFEGEMTNHVQTESAMIIYHNTVHKSFLKPYSVWCRQEVETVIDWVAMFKRTSAGKIVPHEHFPHILLCIHLFQFSLWSCCKRLLKRFKRNIWNAMRSLVRERWEKLSTYAAIIKLPKETKLCSRASPLRRAHKTFLSKISDRRLLPSTEAGDYCCTSNIFSIWICDRTWI